MEWEFVVALLIAVPVILFPVAFIWYLNIGGIVAVVRQKRARKQRQITEDTATAASVKINN